LNPKHSLSGTRAPPPTVIARQWLGASRDPLVRNDVKLEERVPSDDATPADQLSSALQTQNLDLNRSNFQSKHSPEVQSMD
jgi:hypothetical protein